MKKEDKKILKEVRKHCVYNMFNDRFHLINVYDPSQQLYVTDNGLGCSSYSTDIDNAVKEKQKVGMYDIKDITGLYVGDLVYFKNIFKHNNEYYGVVSNIDFESGVITIHYFTRYGVTYELVQFNNTGVVIKKARLLSKKTHPYCV